MGTEAQVNRSRGPDGESEDSRPGRPRSFTHNSGMHGASDTPRAALLQLPSNRGSLFTLPVDVVSRLPPGKCA